MDIFHVNNNRGALCLSQGGRMGYPAWVSGTTITVSHFLVFCAATVEHAKVKVYISFTHISMLSVSVDLRVQDVCPAFGNRRLWVLWYFLSVGDTFLSTIYSTKYAHGSASFVLYGYIYTIYSVIVWYISFIYHVHQDCFICTGAIPQFPWWAIPCMP